MTTKFDRIQVFHSVDLYPVITESFCQGRSSAEVCRQVLAGGVRIVQLREKEKSKKEIYALARVYRELTEASRALLIIDDHLDIALAVDADGVHLGREDMPLEVARRMAPDILIGASTHSLEEARAAELKEVDYLNFGPIFETPTKGNCPPALGVESICELQKQIQLPFTVMGGIKADNLDAVLCQGAKKIAMITEITQAEKITEKVMALREQIRHFVRSSIDPDQFAK